jgi:DNA replication protein DnaC
MTEELEQLLKNLRLRRMLSVYDEQLRAAEKAQVSYSEFVAGLLRSQWHDRQESALEWRIRRANLPKRDLGEVLLDPHDDAQRTHLNGPRPDACDSRSKQLRSLARPRHDQCRCCE